MFSTRWRFLAAGIATVVGIAAVAVHGWQTLDDVSRDAEEMAVHLESLRRIERLEAELHELGAGPSSLGIRGLERAYAAVRDDPRIGTQWALVLTLEQRIADARMDRTPQSWARAAEVVSELEKVAISSAIDVHGDSSRPLRRTATDLLQIGAVAIVLFGVLAVLAFLRLRRERRETHARLRKSDRLAALGTMAASVAHEINNPLATIAGCADAVRDRLRRAPQEHEDSLEYLGMIRDETRRCRDIVRGLRDLARDTPPAMAPADLAGLVREVVRLVSIQQGETAVTFETAGASQCEIVCDPDKVKQLLLNLLVNARDACAAGGKVRVSVNRTSAGRAEIVVEDDGRGIAREELDRVFEPFHTSKTRGLGLGLFLCERIASLHNGTIRAESDGPGRGARFVVTLPAPLDAGA